MVMRTALWLMVMSLGASSASCTSRSSPPQAAREPGEDGRVDASAAPGASGAPAGSAASAESAGPTAKTSSPAGAGSGDVASYLKAHLPKGGSVEGGSKLLHLVAPGDTYPSIAAAYLDLTEIYSPADLAKAVEKKNPSLVAGQKIEIPSPLTRAPQDPKEERLGWPEDRALRGVFFTGPAAAKNWTDVLDKLAARGLNAVVLDAKDYMGPVNYPTKAKIAVEIGAAAKPSIPDLARIIRFAHWRGIRIILRIPCFHDPWADKKLKDSRVSLKNPVSGQPIHMDWLDPTSKDAQDYAIELAQEGIDAGADEIQLDYVRFPVHIGPQVAKMPDPKDRSGVIRDFVKRVHAITKPAGVMLSLDLFGVAATGIRDDIERLGQDITVVGPEAEAISPMVYPSHYDKGYMGFPNPADHPEIVGVGTKAAADLLHKVKATTVVRSWIQSFPWRTTTFSSKYVVDQTKSAESHSGVGWLMWSPSCEYGVVWAGFPPKDAAPAATAPDAAGAKDAPKKK